MPGTAEREASVADLLASEARRDPPTPHVRSVADDLANSLFPGDRSREVMRALATPSNKDLGRYCPLFYVTYIYIYIYILEVGGVRHL